MKYLRRRLLPKTAVNCIVISAISVFSLTSCDKLTELKEKVGDYIGDDDGPDGKTSVVDEKEAKTIIAKESRLVLLEFYSDT